MAFEYKNKDGKDDSGFQWTSYSDLFTALSVVFLLLYVVASVQSGTFGVQKHLELVKANKQVEDLQEQLRVYNTLKESYLEKGATEEETDTYENLMKKLSLLQEENRDEAKKLRAQAGENEQKEKALNQYQQMIRNIVNANMIAQARMKKKDEIIVEKNQVIEQKDENLEDQLTDIRVLERDVSDKQKQIQASEQKISQIEQSLDSKVKQLNLAYRQQKISKAKMQQQVQALRAQSEQQIASLQQQKEQREQELQQKSQQLTTVSSQLSTTQNALAGERQEKQKLVGQLQQERERTQGEIEKARGEFEVKRRLDEQRFQAALQKERVGAAERAKREAAFREKLAAEKGKLDQQIAGLNQKMGETEGKLKQARETIEARERLTKQIVDNFKKNGVDAQVDPGSGDVILSFGNNYFDTGSAQLKTGMIEKLQKLMPSYSQSLFQDPKTAEKISSVEIVGFASPTYKGKYIDPESLDPSDRAAVNFNLDLSYNRAKSIFNHIFDTKKMSYPNQRRLLPLVKVTGRSFLAEGAKGRGIASSMTHKEYCAKFDCTQSQKVMIKFNVESK